MAASPCANAACSNPETAGHCAEMELKQTHTHSTWHINTTKTILRCTDHLVCQMLKNLFHYHNQLHRTKSNQSYYAAPGGSADRWTVGGLQVSHHKSGSIWFTVAYRVKWHLIHRLVEQGISEPHKWLTCSLMCVQADKLYGALMWCSAGFTVLDMLSTWTVPEGMAVSY